MRVLVFLSLIAFLNSCKKDDFKPYPEITGKWIWLSTYFIYPLGEANPLTPLNTGNEEILIFNLDGTWRKTINGIKTDSGSYSLGHGTYLPYPEARIFEYDSICYYRNGIKVETGDYFEIHNDTLHFNPYLAGRFFSYSLPHNGSKFWKRQ